MRVCLQPKRDKQHVFFMPPVSKICVCLQLRQEEQHVLFMPPVINISVPCVCLKLRQAVWDKSCLVKGNMNAHIINFYCHHSPSVTEYGGGVI